LLLDAKLGLFYFYFYFFLSVVSAEVLMLPGHFIRRRLKTGGFGW